MREVTLGDGRRLFCLRRPEALALDGHISGYFTHGITVDPGATVIDVGANIGLFSLRVLERLGGDAHVHAFEPVPPIFDVLQRNLAPWAGPRLHLHRVAVGAAEGEVGITYFPRMPSISTAHPELWRPGSTDLAGSIRGNLDHPPMKRWWVGLVPKALSPWIGRYMVGASRNYRCPGRTLSGVLDSFGVDRIDLLKIDVEGAELDVLSGISERDWPRIRQIVAEVHDVAGRAALFRHQLVERGFAEVTITQEPGFSGTSLHNVYARR